VSPSAGLEHVEKRKFLALSELELQPLGCPARRQSLYRLRWLHGIMILITDYSVCRPSILSSKLSLVNYLIFQ
jgi:hypothetical protein